MTIGFPQPGSTCGSFYRPLSAEALRRLDQAARQILARVGIKVPALGCLEQLEQAGIRVERTGQRIFFDSDCLDHLLEQAPSTFTLCGRDPVHDVELGRGKVHFVNGGRVFRILDMGSGGYRRTMLHDIARTATLVEHLDNISWYIIACQAYDVTDPDAYHLNDFYQALSHTRKHVMGGCDSPAVLEQLLQMVSLIAGGEERLRANPLISIITNPISPLTIGCDTLQVLQFCAEHSVPVTCAPAPIAGATAPVTLAGTLAQMHAESLAGIALTQVFTPGAKVMYGAVPTTMDLRRMDFSIGSTETALLDAAAVQLARMYNLPIYGSGGCTEAKQPDIQAGVEKSISNVLMAMSGADCIHLAAGMLDSANSISYEQYVIDDEIIAMIRRLLRGIRVDEETIALEVIEKVGPGGQYVTEEHTVDHMLEEFFYPDLAERSLFDVWDKEGRPGMLTRAHSKVNEILEAYREASLDPELIEILKKEFPGLIV